MVKSAGYLTKKYFDKKIKNFVTRDYLNKKIRDFVTKDYLNEKIKNFVTKDYLDKKIKNFVTKDYLNERFVLFKGELKDDLYQIKDEIMGELKRNRENDETHQFSHMRINDDVQDLDKRVKNLEKHATAL